MLFNAMVSQVLIHGVEAWDGTISFSAWNDLEKTQKILLQRHLGIKSSAPYPVMLFETRARPIELIAM
jgi:hypothetical protein